MIMSLSTLCWDREATTKRYSRSIEPMAIPLQPYIALRDLIDWMGRHVIEIPEDMAQRIEAYGAKWESTLTPWSKKKSLFFPPEPQLVLTYRRWKAAAYLYENLVVIEDHQALWRNWSVTGEPRRLRTDERLGAISVLESISRAAERHFWATLNGERGFNPAADINFPVDLDEKQRDWLDNLGFEKKEIFAALSPEFIVKDVPGQKHSPTLNAIGTLYTDACPTSSIEATPDGLKTREQQFRAIETGAKELKYNLKSIQRGGKKAIQHWCLEHYPDLFKSKSKKNPASKFEDAWRDANAEDRIIMKDRDVYANRKRK